MSRFKNKVDAQQAHIFSLRALAGVLALLCGGFWYGCHADSAYERTRLGLILRQLDSLDLLVRQAESGTELSNGRYRFDYPRLSQDLQRIRAGVQGYLSPSRAQPRDPDELLGEYRGEAPAPKAAP